MFCENYVKNLDSCKCQSINSHACAYTTLDRTAYKLFFCMIRGSYVPNLVKIGPQITSQSTPQTPDRHWTPDARHWTHCRDFIFCPTLCIAMDRQKLTSPSEPHRQGWRNTL